MLAPTFSATRAVTIEERPETIWPWIVQIGFGRAGWYSYDVLDNLGRHSTERIIPELQHIEVGDLIPVGPAENAGMRIKAFEPSRGSGTGEGMSTQGRKPENDGGPPSAAVYLYWIPLGAGQRVVRLSGRLFEAISARLQRRRSYDLYHSALVVFVPRGCFVIEQAPVIDALGQRRGVVLEGPVGTRLAGRFRHFRYEVRRWKDGVIPDISAAVSSPVRVSDDLVQASQILDLVPCIPALVWGRDECHTGEMWNSNSVTSWLLASAGIDAARIQPPHRGRAPGWRSGRVIAAREAARADGRSNRADTLHAPATF